MNTLAQETVEKKRMIAEDAELPMALIANDCIHYLDNPDKLDDYLSEKVESLNRCSRIYVTDNKYKQLSSNISKNIIEPEYRYQDLSKRPYLQSAVPLKGMIISNIYQDVRSSNPCITIVHALYSEGVLFGFLFADFEFIEVSISEEAKNKFSTWQQFKGDPAIRGGLFNQQRSDSLFDLNIKKAHEIASILLLNNGVFHMKLHYSSARLSLWLYDNPHHYQLHSVDELINGTVFGCYAKQKQPNDACVSEEQINIAFQQFEELRFADENIYLRSASLNIINGMVGLNFSCDGSHYIPVQEFIDNNLDYWLGKLVS